MAKLRFFGSLNGVGVGLYLGIPCGLSVFRAYL